MAEYPEKLQEIVEDFSMMNDRNERIEYLIEMADRFDEVKVPTTLSQRPHDEAHQVKFCESDAYVWATERPDGTLDFSFDVLNPQGLSAMAMAVILGETLSGQPLDTVEAINTDLVFKIFGQEISMGKGQGLMGIINMIREEAHKRRAGS